MKGYPILEKVITILYNLTTTKNYISITVKYIRIPNNTQMISNSNTSYNNQHHRSHHELRRHQNTFTSNISHLRTKSIIHNELLSNQSTENDNKHTKDQCLVMRSTQEHTNTPAHQRSVRECPRSTVSKHPTAWYFPIHVTYALPAEREVRRMDMYLKVFYCRFVEWNIYVDDEFNLAVCMWRVVGRISFVSMRIKMGFLSFSFDVAFRDCYLKIKLDLNLTWSNVPSLFCCFMYLKEIIISNCSRYPKLEYN